MTGTSDKGGHRVRALLMALPVVVAALWLLVIGGKVIAYEQVQQDAQRTPEERRAGGDAALAVTAERLASWRDEAGLRHLARRAYRNFEREERPLSLDALANAVSVVEVAPADGWGWIDVAGAAWISPAGALVSGPAIDMAYLVAPFEERQAEYRIRFVLATWEEASEEQKRRASQAIVSLLRVQGMFRGAMWRQIRKELPPDVLADVDARVAGLDPAYKPPAR